MAFSFAARRIFSASSPGSLVQKSTTASDLCVVRRSRWSSSSSSSSSSPKPDEKVPKDRTASAIDAVNDRIASAIDAVNDRKLPPELRGQRNNVRSESDIINVVEHRVWHAMEEGKFENLPGKGKPLNLSSNPHADPAEDTLYRILNKNGCAPQWVELNKEIRNGIAEWRLALKKVWTYKTAGDDAKWFEVSEPLKLRLRDLNSKVLHYNLIVPFSRHMFGFKWEKEMDRLNEETQVDKS